MSVLKRAIGSLVGLSVCDAVGTAVEFMPPGSFEPLTDMIGGGKFSLLPGEWTDDTSMALCLAESLIECRGYNPVDQMKRYLRWYQEGHLSSNGECFDVGKTVGRAIYSFERSKQKLPYPGSTAEGAAGNGSLMRLCPVPLLYCKQPSVAMEMSKESSRTTHGPKAALDACRYFGGLIVGCLLGASKEELLCPRYSPCGCDYWDKHPMVPEVDAVAAGSFKQLEPPDIRASGYVVRSLEAVLWAFHHTSNFKEGCLKVVNLGDDADTVGAIYGQLAGAYYGVDAIPGDWREKCALCPLIELFAKELVDLSETVSIPDVSVLETTNWSEVQTPVPHHELSLAYQNVKLTGYDLLEAKNKEIVRRLNPCPKQYKTLEAFDSDVESLTDQYKALKPECQDEKILGSFQHRWTHARERLTNKLSRGRV